MWGYGQISTYIDQKKEENRKNSEYSKFLVIGNKYSLNINQLDSYKNKLEKLDGYYSENRRASTNSFFEEEYRTILTKCPNCSEYLKYFRSNDESYIGCSNFPHCNYMENYSFLMTKSYKNVEDEFLYLFKLSYRNIK